MGVVLEMCWSDQTKICSSYPTKIMQCNVLPMKNAQKRTLLTCPWTSRSIVEDGHKWTGLA